nr:hypothetical protein Q903MT_gene377 [Picea sitchensis]
MKCPQQASSKQLSRLFGNYNNVLLPSIAISLTHVLPSFEASLPVHSQSTNTGETYLHQNKPSNPLLYRNSFNIREVIARPKGVNSQSIGRYRTKGRKSGEAILYIIKCTISA